MGPDAWQGLREYEAWKGYVTTAVNEDIYSIWSIEGEVVRWSIDGSLFIVLAGSAIDVYSTVRTLDLPFLCFSLVSRSEHGSSAYNKPPFASPRCSLL